MAFVLTLNLFALTASTPDIEAETINDKFELYDAEDIQTDL